MMRLHSCIQQNNPTLFINQITLNNMKMKTPYFIGIALLLVSFSASAQIDPSAALSIDTTDKGFLPPRLTTIQRDAITNPATALQIYNLDNAQLEVWNGTAWVTLAGNSSAIADTDGDTQIQTEENSDEDILRFDTAGTERMVIDNAGNVGIGTGSPSDKLHVNGSLKLEGDAVFMGYKNSTGLDARFLRLENGDDSSGAGVAIGAAGLTVIGGGESASAYFNAIANKVTEDMVIANDNGIRFVTDMQSGYASRKEAMYITEGGDVGIGTTNPIYDLDIHGNGRLSITHLTSHSAINLTNASTGNYWHIYGPTGGAEALKFAHNTGGAYTERFTVSSDGSVGIGTSNPTSRLHLNGSGSWGDTSSAGLTIETTVANSEIGLRLRSTATEANSWYIGENQASVGNSHYAWFYGTSMSGGTQKMRLTSDGNLGIGTNSPSVKLHVNGNLKLEGDLVTMRYKNSTGLDAAFIRLENGDDSLGAGVAIGGGGLTIIGGGESASAYLNAIANKSIEDMVITNDHGIRFVTDMQSGYSARQEAMYITSNGDVGIGTTAPTHRLSVNGSAGKSGGGSWSTFSDRRIKKDISPYTKGLAEIIQINPVNFTYTDQGPFTYTGESQVGIIAQEIQEILPSTVSETKTEIFDDLLQFNGSELTFTLINAVKELQAENEALKAQNIAVMERLAALENQ